METWATQRLDALVAGTAQLPPVIQTLQLGSLDEWTPGLVRKTWVPTADLLNVDGTMFGGYIAALADQILAFAAMGSREHVLSHCESLGDLHKGREGRARDHRGTRNLADEACDHDQCGIQARRR